jgi:hypothetical protein
MLDEKSLRRPDFLPGIPVLLADGQSWSLPPAPDRSDPGTAEGGPAAAAEGGAPVLDDEATLTAILDAEDEAERLRAELALAIALLARNYHLTPADYQEILGGDSGSPVIATLQRTLHHVALEHVRPLNSKDKETRRQGDKETRRQGPCRYSLRPAAYLTGDVPSHR